MTKNQIRYISQKDKEELMNTIDKEVINVQIIDGRDIQTLEQLLVKMAIAYKFPSLEYNLDGFIDWMSDIDQRFNENEFVLIIDNYDEMMKNQLDEKRMIMSIFVESILYWWDEECVECYNGKRIDFNVYLVNSWEYLSKKIYYELTDHQKCDEKISNKLNNSD